jgi:hypothetical protein
LVVSEIENTVAAQSVMVERTTSLMVRIIRHELEARNPSAYQGERKSAGDCREFRNDIPCRPCGSTLLEPMLLWIIGVKADCCDLLPEFLRNRSREIANRFRDAFRSTHADDRRRQARIPGRELQGDRW